MRHDLYHGSLDEACYSQPAKPTEMALQVHSLKESPVTTEVVNSTSMNILGGGWCSCQIHFFRLQMEEVALSLSLFSGRERNRRGHHVVLDRS